MKKLLIVISCISLISLVLISCGKPVSDTADSTEVSARQNSSEQEETSAADGDPVSEADKDNTDRDVRIQTSVSQNGKTSSKTDDNEVEFSAAQGSAVKGSTNKPANTTAGNHTGTTITTTAKKTDSMTNPEKNPSTTESTTKKVTKPATDKDGWINKWY